MKAIERLYEYLEYQNIKPTVFERNAGFSSGYLSIMRKRNADIGESAMNKVIDYFHLLSVEWLLTGKGDMIKKNETNRVEEPREEYRAVDANSTKCEQCKMKDELIGSLNREIVTQGHFIEHLIKSNVASSDGPEKRKASSGSCGHSKLSEAV